MAKVLASLAQYDRDNGDVRERAIVIMNSFVWQVGLDHMTLLNFIVVVLVHGLTCMFLFYRVFFFQGM